MGSSRKKGATREAGPWSVARARRRFADLIRSVAHEPQPIYNRDRLVGVVVDAETFAEFVRWKDAQAARSIGEAMEELRALCAEEDYSLEVPRRADRDNPFGRRPRKS